MLDDAESSNLELCDNLEGWYGMEGWRVIYLWLINIVVWQKPTQYCKAIILQLQINKLIKQEKTTKRSQETILHMDITRWSIPKSDWLCSLLLKMEKLSMVSKKKDQELTVAQIMKSLL